ncbi:MAG TPA: hypothetical protein VFS40_07560 [Gemmatimonadales bacterium]|nr:hypothetical protein [Gemmatimonadales bacterium]
MIRVRAVGPALAPVVATLLFALTLAPGCARAQVPTRPTAPATPAAADTPLEPGGGELLPAGFGSLNQNDVAVRLRTPDLEVRIVLLDEGLLRLLAPDSYAALHQTAASRRAAIDSVGRQRGVSVPGLALVGFYGLRQGVQFDPQLVTITARGRILRPIGIVPLGAAFNTQQLDLRGQAMAIYVFEETIPVTEPLGFAYGVARNDDWARRLPVLERERQRVLARARAAGAAPAEPTAEHPDSTRR